VIRELRKRLQDELKALEYELRNELPKEIKIALALGDLRENAEYHSALERQSYVKARMGQLSKRLGELASFNYDAIPRDRVGLGSTVTLIDLDTDAEVIYKIVMNDDADTTLAQISIGSPIGRGLVGKKEGDEVTIQIPAGTRKFEIVTLRTIHESDGTAAGDEGAALAAGASPSSSSKDEPDDEEPEEDEPDEDLD
jgi:transcription elongation factor GreA